MAVLLVSFMTWRKTGPVLEDFFSGVPKLENNRFRFATVHGQPTFMIVPEGNTFWLGMLLTIWVVMFLVFQTLKAFSIAEEISRRGFSEEPTTWARAPNWCLAIGFFAFAVIPVITDGSMMHKNGLVEIKMPSYGSDVFTCTDGCSGCETESSVKEAIGDRGDVHKTSLLQDSKHGMEARFVRLHGGELFVVAPVVTNPNVCAIVSDLEPKEIGPSELKDWA